MPTCELVLVVFFTCATNLTLWLQDFNKLSYLLFVIFPRNRVRFVCMYVRIFIFAQNLTAYTVTEALWKCIIVLEKTRQILVERRTVSVIATGHELSVEVSSKEPDRNRRNFFVHIALSYSTRWRDCLALLNAGYSVWQLLRQGYITRRGRWVLTDVNTCI